MIYDLVKSEQVKAVAGLDGGKAALWLVVVTAPSRWATVKLCNSILV